MIYNYLMNQDNQTSSDNLDLGVWATPQGARLQQAVRANQTASDMFDDCLARFMGINRTDARCMDIIERHGRVTAGQLASDSGLTTGAVTVVIDRLEAIGYVVRERDPTDRRKVWIKITQLAGDLSDRLFSHFQLIGPAMLARFTPDQLAAIIEFLEVGGQINRELSFLLEQHVERGTLSAETRMINARAFQRDAGVKMKAIVAAMENGRKLED
ncbi:DNA-binding MarR family transcriptional regulator [Devosia sp. UYZn731]